MDPWRAVDPSEEIPEGSLIESEVRIVFYIDPKDDGAKWTYSTSEGVPFGILVGMMYTVAHAMQHELRDSDDQEEEEEENG